MKFAKLGEVADVNWGDTSLTKASYVNDGFTAYSATGADGCLPYFHYDRDAIVLSAIGARCGKTWFASGKWSAIKNTIRFWSESRDLDNRYLYWATCDPALWPKRGAAQPFITIGDARKIEIAIPPLAEQRRIAAILDQVDGLRSKRVQALAALDKLPQAVFSEVFGDPAYNTQKWKLEECNRLCKRIVVGVVVKPASYYCGQGVPAVRGTNIKPGGIDLSDVVYFSDVDNTGKLSKSRIWTGDLLIVRTGQPGLCAIVPESLNGANAIDVIIVTPDTQLIRPVFLRELLNSAGGKQMVLSSSRGQIQQHFNVGSLSEAKIIVPPLALQMEFENRIQAVAEVRASAWKSLQRTEDLFGSLQHRAFNGGL